MSHFFLLVNLQQVVTSSATINIDVTFATTIITTTVVNIVMS